MAIYKKYLLTMAKALSPDLILQFHFLLRRNVRSKPIEATHGGLRFLMPIWTGATSLTLIKETNNEKITVIICEVCECDFYGCCSSRSLDGKRIYELLVSKCLWKFSAEFLNCQSNAAAAAVAYLTLSNSITNS